MAADKPSTSKLARSARLLGTLARIGQKEIGARIGNAVRDRVADSAAAQLLKTRVDQAKVLAESLGQLKGAAMKFGQLLSVEGADFLPPEVLDVLSRVQDQAPPLDIAWLRETVRREIGDELFRELTIADVALASASIGQVHRAQFRGRELVLKVQYPGIEASIDSDLRTLQRVVKGLGWTMQKNFPTDELFAELRAVLLQETDYALELTHMRRYADMIATDGRFVVPSPVLEISTRRVLAMSFEPGLRLREWLASDPPAAVRAATGQAVLDLYFREFFANGFVQTDPNFANFLFRPETQQLVVLDFGAVREYSPDFVRNYRALLREIGRGDEGAILARAIDDMQLLSPRESPETRAAFVAMLRVSVAPFLSRQPFDFADADYSAEVRRAVNELVRSVRYSAPPHQLVFLHRKLGGIYHLLKRLRVAVDLSPFWREVLAE